MAVYLYWSVPGGEKTNLNITNLHLTLDTPENPHLHTFHVLSTTWATGMYNILLYVFRFSLFPLYVFCFFFTSFCAFLLPYPDGEVKKYIMSVQCQESYLNVVLKREIVFGRILL